MREDSPADLLRLSRPLMPITPRCHYARKARSSWTGSSLGRRRPVYARRIYVRIYNSIAAKSRETVQPESVDTGETDNVAGTGNPGEHRRWLSCPRKTQLPREPVYARPSRVMAFGRFTRCSHRARAAPVPAKNCHYVFLHQKLFSAVLDQLKILRTRSMPS